MLDDSHNVTVRLICKVPNDKLSDDDRDLPLEVPILIDKDVQVEKIADAALDVFYSEVAFDNIENFEFEVWKEGSQLDITLDHDSYSLWKKGRVA